MDQIQGFLNKQGQDQQGGGDGIAGMLNDALGGGQQGEAKEDQLDKALDMFQERVLKQGDQSNEDAIEQGKDEMISDAIRDQYKKFSGKDLPIADK